MYVNGELASNIAIPNTTDNISAYAFLGCTSLTSVTIPNSLKSIGENAFRGCSSLKSVNISDLSSWVKINFANDDSNPLVYAHNLYVNGELASNIAIPNTIDNISAYAFNDCTSLTSVTIPNSVTIIGNDAFCGCSGLTSVIMQNSVKSIGNGSFFGCSSLCSIDIPNSVTTIGSSAFGACSSLASITIHNGVISIGSAAFSECSSLVSIVIPNSVEYIYSGAFENCSSLTSIELPNSIDIIDYGLFAGCSSLTSISIPNSVKGIEEVAFYNCSALSSVFLGSNVIYINRLAFSNCKELLDVYCTSNVAPVLESAVFKNSDIQYATLHVPASSIESFSQSYEWNKFGVIKVIENSDDEKKKCATPIISYFDDKLHFACETEGAKCYYTLNNSDVKTGETLAEDNNVNLSACYDITCYAKAEGYDNSDVATAKLYWLPSSGTLEGDNINNVAMRGIAIQSDGGFINISGLDNNEKVDFYGVDGKTLGSAKSIDGNVSFSAKQGTVVVAKIGKESVKIFTN